MLYAPGVKVIVHLNLSPGFHEKADAAFAV